METRYKKLGENFTFGKRFLSQKWNTKHYEKMLYSGKHFWSESANKKFGENVTENLKNLQKNLSFQ